VPTLKDITQVDNGARFHNGDLHIHSNGGSHDVKDASMTPEGNRMADEGGFTVSMVRQQVGHMARTILTKIEQVEPDHDIMEAIANFVAKRCRKPILRLEERG
jgi:hypothetical protein